ncbi:uncharacterized protein L3040_000303 [Drepanopeziza brunnea f. sp. 'multigermtubi']|uniref:uncharacterized protein n=1 Tax=Drepanopeziza brunnea f. sp. 'multigermtubi' TaxID=698441 RepID=UPI00239E247B|nr:hypothetical protein L3040_000303 [Drepanopeziza brunnea f. sp. 'multigermtubi']
MPCMHYKCLLDREEQANSEMQVWFMGDLRKVALNPDFNKAYWKYGDSFLLMAMAPSLWSRLKRSTSKDGGSIAHVPDHMITSVEKKRWG